ncbi:MAG: 4-hydroxy-tetrahydrodipicolinate reductase [Deltaproteobacteria bacterium]|nr:4-hydroxy-tetrahydrodipicolinate reductase [Deltaproteobacteria bacterium]
MTIKVCLAGATGWAGSALASGIHEAHDMELIAGVSRTHAGKPLGEAIHNPEISFTLSGSAKEALDSKCDVFVEYTKPDVARQNILLALEAGAHVVVGTSGLTDDDYALIEREAKSRQLGVLAVGNFAITMVLLQKFAEMAARYIPHCEIIDYAGAGKADVPSGTVWELAHRLGQVRESKLDIPLDEIQGPRESRGARLNDTQVHAIRLPGYVISAEVIFGMPDQKLILRHEAGASAEPYVAGAMLAIRKVGTFTGLRRGLDTVMEIA